MSPRPRYVSAAPFIPGRVPHFFPGRQSGEAPAPALGPAGAGSGRAPDVSSLGRVLALVVGLELPRLQRPPPRLVGSVPLHGRRQRGIEGMAGRPAERVNLR